MMFLNSFDATCSFSCLLQKFSISLIQVCRIVRETKERSPFRVSLSLSLHLSIQNHCLVFYFPKRPLRDYTYYPYALIKLKSHRERGRQSDFV